MRGEHLNYIHLRRGMTGHCFSPFALYSTNGSNKFDKIEETYPNSVEVPTIVRNYVSSR